MPRHRVRRAFPVATVLLLLTACGPTEAEPVPPRLVVLYAPCSLNRDFLEPYGALAGSTPNLASFASEGAVFERHQTEAGQSGSAYASLFAGTQAYRHGVLHHPTILSGDLTLVTEVFAGAGYQTWFWSGQPMGGAKFNFGQGVLPRRVFKRGKDDHAGLTANDADFDRLLARLAADPEHRAYVQVNFTLTHHPYQAHVRANELPGLLRGIAADLGSTEGEVTSLLELYDANRIELQWSYAATAGRLGLEEDEQRRLAAILAALYRYDVAELDRWFGRFLARIAAAGLEDETLIAFTADHGEVFDRPTALYRWTHGFQLAPEEIQVPLIVRGAGVRPGRYAGVTRSIDVFPTLVGLSGIEPAEARTWDGVDLARSLRGQSPAPRLSAFSHSALPSAVQLEALPSCDLRDAYFPEPDPTLLWTALRDGDRYHLLRRDLDGAWRLEVYDLARDPGLTHDLFEAGDAGQAAVRAQLEEYRASIVERYERAALDPLGNLSVEEQTEHLRELGYVR